MIPPARSLAANRDVIDRVVHIGWINAQCIESEADTGCIAHMRDEPGRDHQADGASDFSNPGQQHDLLGEGDPAWRDR